MIENQSIISFLLGVFSAIVVLSISFIVSFTKNKVLQYTLNLPYPYLVLGVIASVGIIVWTTLILRTCLDEP